MEKEFKKMNFLRKKNFVSVSLDGGGVKIKIDDVLFPFGPEYYEGKKIINCELNSENNTHHNIISSVLGLEKRLKELDFEFMDIDVKQNLRGKGLISSVKNSLKGSILRTHSVNADVYILKKNGDKMIIDDINIKNATADVEILLNGIWFNDNNFGLLWHIKDIKIKKLG